MTAVLRNNAALTRNLGGVRLGGGGGSGKTLGLRKGEKVKRKLDIPEDPAAELMPAAEFLGHETDFAAITEQFPDSPFDPARRKVLGRLMGMFAMDYQGAGPEERRFLRRLLAAPNAREGYVANRALHLCAAAHILRRTLAIGVAESRFATRPTHGFLGAVQARMAVTTLRLLGPASREQVWNLLTLCGTDSHGQMMPTADRVLERALVLKAMAARRHQLGPWSVHGPRALSQLTAFATEIRGLRRELLAVRTTLFPGDPSRRAACLATLTNPVARAAALARAELDPIYAWHEHGRNRQDLTVTQTAAKPRERLAELEELPALDRSPLLDRPRLHQALAEARTRTPAPLHQDQLDALSDYLVGRELAEGRLLLKNQAMQLLKTQGFDVIRPESVEAIRTDARGIYKFDAARALGDLLSRFTGATYVRRVFSDQITAGADPLGQISRALANGLCVPISIAELRSSFAHAVAAVSSNNTAAGPGFTLVYPPHLELVNLAAQELIAPQLPDSLGRRARADAYMAPAALDLLAAPFGLPFPELGIEDHL